MQREKVTCEACNSTGNDTAWLWRHLRSSVYTEKKCLSDLGFDTVDQYKKSFYNQRKKARVSKGEHVMGDKFQDHLIFNLFPFNGYFLVVIVNFRLSLSSIGLTLGNPRRKGSLNRCAVNPLNPLKCFVLAPIHPVNGISNYEITLYFQYWTDGGETQTERKREEVRCRWNL